jgi:hypothetical protein
MPCKSRKVFLRYREFEKHGQEKWLEVLQTKDLRDRIGEGGKGKRKGMLE